MKLTETILVTNFKCMTNGHHYVSLVDGQKIFWNYRTDYVSRTDGYTPVSTPQMADAIYLDGDRTGRILIDHDNRPDYSNIIKAENEAFGTDIKS